MLERHCALTKQGLDQVAGDPAERFAVPNDLLNYRIRIAYEQRSLRTSLGVKIHTRHLRLIRAPSQSLSWYVHSLERNHRLPLAVLSATYPSE